MYVQHTDTHTHTTPQHIRTYSPAWQRNPLGADTGIAAPNLGNDRVEAGHAPGVEIGMGIGAR